MQQQAEHWSALHKNFLFLPKIVTFLRQINLPLVQTSGVQGPDFGFQSVRIFGMFLDLDWIVYRLPFNRIRIRIIQMKKIWSCKNIVWNNSCLRKNYDLSISCTKNLLVWFLPIDCNVPGSSGSSISDWGHLKWDVVWNGSVWRREWLIDDSIVLLWRSPTWFRWMVMVMVYCFIWLSQ